jgi:hypothetical protein
VKSLKNKILPQLIIIYSRYLLGGSLVFASLIKIKGKRFTTFSGEDAPMGTVFHFFETMYQTGLYWQFIGLMQLLAGFLLLTQRWAKLGAVVTLPVMLNVFIINISIPGFNFTPVVTGMMLFANALLIAWHWDELKFLFNMEPEFETSQRLEHSKVWERTGLAIFLFTFLYRLFVDAYDPVMWFGVCSLIGVAGLIAGLKKS